MSSNNSIKVYARLKPNTNSIVKYNIYREKSTSSKKSGEDLIFAIPENIDVRQVQNRFWFNKVFDPCATQDDVFDIVMKPVIDSVLNGYNGTIFAYGQTGSGKTYTITGSTENYADRGIIPRAIQYIFNVIKNSPEVLYSVYISYLEIYNENGYDLLDQRSTSRLEDLQRVTTLDDNHGNTHLRNLSVLPVNAETDALRLLFLGDTNRTIAETPMNPFSTRSHCIFTIHIGIKKPTTKTFRRGKLHLVDLAGSERIAKTNPTGTRIISEAKHINLSLHYLEQVILALSESKRYHIPYRNSLLTTVLRDSLGGNCLTSMIATLSLKETNFMETISTCRFAQRVALIKNDVSLNEENDPEQELISLKMEINLLKTQLAGLSDIDVTKPLTAIEEQQCKDALMKFIKGLTPELEVGSDMRKVHFCFHLFKRLLETRNDSRKSTPRSEVSNNLFENASVENYKQLIKQRDSEISILINLLRSEREKSSGDKSLTKGIDENKTISSRNEDEFSTVSTILTPRSIDLEKFNDSEKETYNLFMIKPENSKEINKYQKILNEKITIARKLASVIENVKSVIVSLRQKLETCQNSGSKGDIISIREQLTHYQKIYQNKIEQLRNLKIETDHIKHGLEKATIRLENRFKELHQLNSDDSLQKIPCRDITMEQSSNKSCRPSTYKIKKPSQTKFAETNCSFSLPEVFYCEDTGKRESENSDKQRHGNKIQNNPNEDELYEAVKADEDDELVLTYKSNSSRSDIDTKSENFASSQSISKSAAKANNSNNNQKQIADDELKQIDHNCEPNSKIPAPAITQKIENVEKVDVTVSGKIEDKITTDDNKSKNLEDWEIFVKSLPLTGDEEVDTEIINFYKQQFGILE